MEYQQKKEQILQTIQYHNLLTFSLVQNKLERNFKSIVQALKLNKSNNGNLQHQVQKLKLFTNSKVQEINNRLLALQNANLEHTKQNNDNRKKEESKKQIKIKEESKKHLQINENTIDNSLDDKFVNQNQFNLFLQDFNKFKDGIKNNSNNDYLENYLKQLQKEINGLKGEVATLNQLSHKQSLKSIKRQSVANNVSKKSLVPERQSIKQIVHSNKQNGTAKQIDQNKNIITNDYIQRPQYEKQMNNLYLELNTTKLGYEQLRQQINELKKKQFKHSSLIKDLDEQMKKLDKKNIVDCENFQKMFKSINMEILNLQNNQLININQTKQPANNNSTNNNNSNNKQISQNYKNQLNDKLSKLQALIQQSVTQSEFERFKKEVRDKLQAQDKNHQQLKNNTDQQFRKIYELLDTKNGQISNLDKNMQELKELFDEKGSQWQRKNNIVLSKIQQLKKNLQNLRQDLQFYQSLNGQNGQQKNNLEKLEAEDNTKNKNIDSKELENLKKYFTNKLHDQRTYLVGLIRDIQRKLGQKSSVEQDIVGIWDKLSQLNLFLNKKADQQDIKKYLAYLEKKLNSLNSQLNKNQDNTEDARIAKTNWFCLSCDKNLQNYTGKVGKTVVWDYLPYRTTNGKFYKEQKKNLPNIVKK